MAPTAMGWLPLESLARVGRKGAPAQHPRRMSAAAEASSIGSTLVATTTKAGTTTKLTTTRLTTSLVSRSGATMLDTVSRSPIESMPATTNVTMPTLVMARKTSSTRHPVPRNNRAPRVVEHRRASPSHQGASSDLDDIRKSRS